MFSIFDRNCFLSLKRLEWNSSTHMCSMVFKETISYYITKNSNVFCTFLDASKVFDRGHYCKLFHLILRRGLPSCIVRVLINLYVGYVIRGSWAGLLSSPFNAVNGVKQGEVLSPVLFCIYIYGLLTSWRNFRSLVLVAIWVQIFLVPWHTQTILSSLLITFCYA